jgi:hypothetical protein
MSSTGSGDWNPAEDKRPGVGGLPTFERGKRKWSLLVLFDWPHEGQIVKSWTRLAIWESDGEVMQTQHGRVYPMLPGETEKENDGA